ncbi:hypothetical protein Pse7367_3576 [Thalassoporum mexicanum PCC 7367]|uniref:carboxypeptidase-like regulatory domain-containing protein n=1 Tax=Thalassoporum mexicanum TaxID=3457544 RepID=UPI00029FE2EB|nr:carboxypeptidase-like regulatory domain-containing protein [Pseudanabaena sp. PCC 7367]AFY71811.1 hypothetical protein Pse7367_3576 [Pseudanabaena sp. PCC 7367]
MQRQKINLPIAFILIWLGLSLIIFQPGKAIAHALNIQYESTSAIMINVDDGGVALTDAQVNVFAPNDQTEPWLQGKTDSKGDFLFIPDAMIPGDWQVQVRQVGHAGEVIIPIASIANAPEPVVDPAKDSNSDLEESPKVTQDPVNANDAEVETSPAIAIDPVATETSNVATTSGGTATYSPMQKGVMIASVLWGCVGTALFFWRRK